MPRNTTSSDPTAVAVVASPAAPASPAGPSLPATGFLRQTQVLCLVPISKSTLWRRVQACTFPGPVKLSARVTAWRVEDIRRWIDRQGVAS